MNRLFDFLPFGRKEKFYKKSGNLPVEIEIELSSEFPCIGSLIRLRGFKDSNKTIEKGIKCQWYISGQEGVLIKDTRIIHEKKFHKKENLKLRNNTNTQFLSISMLGQKLSVKIKEISDQSDWDDNKMKCMIIEFCPVKISHRMLFFQGFGLYILVLNKFINGLFGCKARISPKLLMQISIP